MSKYLALMRFLLIAFDSDAVLLCGLPIRESILYMIVRIREHLTDNRGEVYVPKHVLEALIDGFMPEILEFFESEEGQREFERWKAEKLAQSEQQNSLDTDTPGKKKTNTRTR